MASRPIKTANDVDGRVLQDAEYVLDDWFGDVPRIDWELFIDILSDKFGEPGDDPYWIPEYDSPAVRKIQKHIGKLRAQS